MTLVLTRKNIFRAYYSKDSIQNPFDSFIYTSSLRSSCKKHYAHPSNIIPSSNNNLECLKHDHFSHPSECFVVFKSFNLMVAQENQPSFVLNCTIRVIRDLVNPLHPNTFSYVGNIFIDHVSLSFIARITFCIAFLHCLFHAFQKLLQFTLSDNNYMKIPLLQRQVITSHIIS